MDPANHHPVVYVLATALVFLKKKHHLDFWNMYEVDFVKFINLRVPWQTKNKYCPSAQMTMPARCTSRFCAKRHATLPHMFVLGLIS